MRGRRRVLPPPPPRVGSWARLGVSDSITLQPEQSALMEPLATRLDFSEEQ